jgi:N-acylneuraminate cytidylyltransferase
VTGAVAIIPARSGSTRIPGKNMREFAGYPIIAYSIRTAIESGLFDDVIVSTDSQETVDLAESLGAMGLLRSPEYCLNEVGTQVVGRNVLDTLTGMGQHYDLACVIYATAPMMTASDLQRGMYEMLARAAKFAMSIGTAPLCDAGQFYWGEPDSFGTLPIFAEHTVMIPIDQDRVCDINVESDWVRAERMYAAMVDG